MLLQVVECLVLVVTLGGQKAPVPDADQLARAKRQIGEIYRADFAKAKKPSELVALAREMMTAAEKLDDDLAGRYVLLTIARDLALAADDRQTAIEAVTTISERFRPSDSTDFSEMLKRGDACFESSKKAKAADRAKLQMEAMEYYLIVRESGGLNRQLAQKRIEKLDAENGTSAVIGGGDELVVWNTHNGGYGERGARQFDVTLLFRGKIVWEKKGVSIEWANNKNPKATVTLPKKRWDTVRLTITKWHGVGGGLGEVQVFRHNKNIALGCPTRSSLPYHPTVATPNAAVDGLIEPEVSDRGYWLLPSGMAGWIELYLGD